MKTFIRIFLTVVTFPLILIFGLIIFAFVTAKDEVDWINFEWF